MNDLSPRLTCYQPSGIAPIGGVVVTLFTGSVAGIFFGAVYAFLNHHDPLVYLNIILTLIWSFLIGNTIAKGIHKHHIRNAPVAAAMGAFAFAVTYIVHWFVYVSTVIIDFETDSPYDIAMIAEVAFSLMKDPKETWALIQEFNGEGVWSLSHSSGSQSEVNGLFLSAVWAAEALVLCYYCVKAPLDEVGRPYSERLGKWMEPQVLPYPIAFIEDEQGFKNSVARNDYSALTSLCSDDEEENGATQDKKTRYRKYATITLYQDPSEPYISVQNVSVKIKKREGDVSTKNVVQYLKISPTVAQNIVTAQAC
jgi:hypothetical protein